MVLRNAIEPARRAFVIARDYAWPHGPVAAAKGQLSGVAPACRASLLLLLLAGIVAAAFLVALDIASRLAQTSDSVQGFVEGHAIARGNVLLSGWNLPVDNYYVTDTIGYAALEWIAGPRPFLLALVPAVTYALFVCTGLAVCLRATRSAPQNAEAAAAAALMLAPSGWIGSWNPLLMSNMHFATVLSALIALALCDRIARSQQKGLALAGWAAFFALVTLSTIASDPFSLVFAFGPALVVLSYDALPRRFAKNGRIALLVLTGAMIAGGVLPLLVARLGGFATEDNIVTALVSPALVGRNGSALVGGILSLDGANPFGTGFSLEAIVFFAVRALVLVTAAGAVVHAARRLLNREGAPLFDRVLCAGVLSVLAACLVSEQFGKGIDAHSPWAGAPPMRYVMPAFLFAAILGARRIPEMLSALSQGRTRSLARGGLVLVGILALSAGALEVPGDQPPWIAEKPPATAAQWLVRSGMTRGDADYWSANLMTAMSGDTLDLRSVVPDDGKVVAYSLSTDTRRHGGAPQFMIWQDGTRSGMTAGDVRATYSVCRIVDIAGYRIALLDGAASERGCAAQPRMERAG